MQTKTVSVLGLAIATALAGSAKAEEAKPEVEPHGAVPAYLAPAAIAAAAVAAVAALAGKGGGGGDSGSGSSTGGAQHTLSYTSAADFQTSEYNAQAGLAWVKAASLYYNGHYRWYTGNAPDAAAGTGIGVKIAVADTGINPREGATGAAIAIDAASSYDFVNGRPGAATDDFGHGSHVAGIIAAPKNGSGMHGLAYNATLVDFKVGNSVGSITASDAQLADMIRRAANAGAMIINNSWNHPQAITAFSAQDLQASFPAMIAASRDYVAKGGVVVFAAGNNATTQPSMQAGLPYRVGGLAPGWLAVVAIDGSGRLASYSNRCGVAAAWCLAAPGGAPDNGLYSMYNNGGYAGMYGTSMATPHASAALAALKSMFVNLSYLQLRERLLHTANRSGAYADASTYGQGLMDLEAASSPVGGIALPTGASASGPTASVASSGIVFQPGAVQALGLQRWVLVVDNYQRAPFWVPAESFFREATPHLVERQWGSLRTSPPARKSERIAPGLRFSQSPGLNEAVSLDLGAARLGFSRGAGGEALLGRQLDLVSLPRLAASAVDTISVGYASDLAGMRFGFVGTLPGAASGEARLLDASPLGSRSALGAVAQRGDRSTRYGLTLALAHDFERPIGMATSGAFEVGDSAAVSTGAFVQHAVSRSSTLEGSFEIAHHRSQAEQALSTPSFVMRTVSFGARTALAAGTSLSASLKREWTGGEAARLQVPLTIAESGALGRVAYALPYDELVGRTAVTLRLDHDFSKRVALRASATHERYGFGVSLSGVAAVLEITE
jgi:subtilisin family serine protease